MIGKTLNGSQDVHDERTRVLIVASGLWIGGAEMVIKHLALSLDPKRFAVTVCHLKSRGQIGDELARAGVDLVAISPENEHVDYFTFLKVAKLIRSRRFQVVHTHTTHGLTDAVMSKLILCRFRHVHTFHFGNYPHTTSTIKFLERLFARGADRLLAVGNAQRKQIQELYKFRDSEIGVQWNGVSPPAPDGAAEFRAQYGIGDRLLVGTIATLIEQKGLPDLMRVARRVRDAGHDAVFAIAGEGPMRAELERLRAELKLEDTVILCGWVRNAAQTAMPTFDIFFQPSLWEAMSVVLLEALAAGKTVVATNVGEAGAVIEHGVDGYLVEPRDVEGMSRALCDLLGDRALRERVGHAARAKWQRSFTVEHMTRAYEEIYSDLAAGRQGVVPAKV